MGFEPERPCIFLDMFLRMRVSNRGRLAARGFMANFSFTETDRED